MYQETIAEDNHGEYDIFNEQSGQSYVVSYDVDHSGYYCIVKASRKHISTENGHTLKDLSTITEINVREYLLCLAISSFISPNLRNEEDVKRYRFNNTKEIATTFALALEKNDIACLGIISEFDNASMKMKKEAMRTLNDIIAENDSPYKEKKESHMHEEIKKAWEYVDLSIKNREATMSKNKEVSITKTITTLISPHSGDKDVIEVVSSSGKKYLLSPRRTHPVLDGIDCAVDIYPAQEGEKEDELIMDFSHFLDPESGYTFALLNEYIIEEVLTHQGEIINYTFFNNEDYDCFSLSQIAQHVANALAVNEEKALDLITEFPHYSPETQAVIMYEIIKMTEQYKDCVIKGKTRQ